MNWIELSRWARQGPVIVVGVGVSFAVAELIALRFRRDGAIAWAQPDEVPIIPCGSGLRVLRVSRSATAWSGVHPDALVSEQRGASSVLSWLLPPSSADGPVADLRFASEVCRELHSAVDSLECLPQRAVVALDGTAGPICSLLAACALKGLELPLVVTSIDQLGHGLHFQMIRRSDAPLVLLTRNLQLGDEVARWCRATGCSLVLRAPKSSCGTTEVFQLVADKLVEARDAGAAGTAWAPSAVADSLRYRIQALRSREVTS